MACNIKVIKDTILKTVTKLKSAPPLDGWKVRLGFIAYSDFGILPQFEIQDFTPSTVWFCHALAWLDIKTSSTGKTNLAEDVVGGIEMTTLFSWESASRLLFHIGDAPAHGFEFHNLGINNDYHIGGDPLKRNLSKIFMHLKMECEVWISVVLIWVSLNNTFWSEL